MIFIYIILFFFLFLILIGAGVIRTILRILLGGGSSSAEPKEGKTRWYTGRNKKKKIFDSSEGEYVDFEEIKDKE